MRVSEVIPGVRSGQSLLYEVMCRVSGGSLVNVVARPRLTLANGCAVNACDVDVLKLLRFDQLHDVMLCYVTSTLCYSTFCSSIDRSLHRAYVS
jgi:hypothetical protein